MASARSRTRPSRPPPRGGRRTIGREAAERRLRLRRRAGHWAFKLRVALEATCGVDLPRLDRDFAGCGGLRPFSIGIDAGAVKAGAVRGETAHAHYGRRKTADGKIKHEVKPLTPPHMHAADVTANCQDLGHPTAVIINRQGADQKPCRSRTRRLMKPATPVWTPVDR